MTDDRAVLPHQMAAAANELIMCMAAVSVRTRLHRAGTLQGTDQSLIARLQRAITGLVQFEGGRFTVDWSNVGVAINDYDLPRNDKLDVAVQALRKSLGSRGISGVAFRLTPDDEQLLHFFRRILTLQLPEVQRMGERGALVQIPGERDLVGILLLVGRPGDDSGSAPGRRSGIGMRVAFEESLMDAGLDWIGRSPPVETDDEALQRFCLGVYTDLVSSTLRFVRLARAIRAGRAPLPALALARLVQSVAGAYALTPELMNACVLLGARDPAPARRIAHTVALTVGIATHRSMTRSRIAEAGLGAFVYGLRERFRQLGDDDPPELSILQLLARESALTPQKVRAIYSAALVGASSSALGGDGARIEVPGSAHLIGLSWACAGCLDGSLHGRLALAPLPMPAVYADLATHYATDPMTARHLSSFGKWLGPVPAGTVVQLSDLRTAVMTTCQGQSIRALPLCDADGSAIKQPAVPVRVGKLDELGGWPAGLDIEGVVSTRQVVHRAASALFYRARKTWQPLIAPRSGQTFTS